MSIRDPNLLNSRVFLYIINIIFIEILLFNKNVCKVCKIQFHGYKYFLRFHHLAAVIKVNLKVTEAFTNYISKE